MTADVARRRIGFQQPTDLVAVHARHHHVEQDQRRPVRRPRDRQRLLAVDGHADAIVVAQHVAEQAQVRRRVVDDQDGELVFHHVARPPEMGQSAPYVARRMPVATRRGAVVFIRYASRQRRATASDEPLESDGFAAPERTSDARNLPMAKQHRLVNLHGCDRRCDETGSGSRTFARGRDAHRSRPADTVRAALHGTVALAILARSPIPR